MAAAATRPTLFTARNIQSSCEPVEPTRGSLVRGRSNRRASRPRPQDSTRSTAATSWAAEAGRVQGMAIATSRIRNGTCFRSGNGLPSLCLRAQETTGPSHGHSLVGRGEVPGRSWPCPRPRTLSAICRACWRRWRARSMGLVPVDLSSASSPTTPETVRARAIYFRAAPRRAGESQQALRPTVLGSSRRHGGRMEAHPHACATPSSGTAGRWCSTTSRATRVLEGTASQRSRCECASRGAPDDGRRCSSPRWRSVADAVAFLARRGSGPRGRGPPGHDGGGERARLRGDPEAPLPDRGRKPRPARGDHRRGGGGGGRDHRGLRRGCATCWSGSGASRGPTRRC